MVLHRSTNVRAEMPWTEMEGDKLAIEYPTWMDKSACGKASVTDEEFDPDDFWPILPNIGKRDYDPYNVKGRFCSECEVTRECLDYSFEKDEKEGIWGALEERERKAIKKGWMQFNGY